MQGKGQMGPTIEWEAGGTEDEGDTVAWPLPSVCTLRLVTKTGRHIITPPPLMPRGMLFMCYSSLCLILYNSINNVKSHVRGSLLSISLFINFIVSLIVLIENNYHFAVAHCPPPLTPASIIWSLHAKAFASSFPQNCQF